MAIPSWLQDVSRAAQLLTRLSLESAAQASMIIKDGELWAYSGELPQPAAKELARMVAQSWAKGRAGDLATFIRLESAPGEHMLYATRLINGMVLAVVHNVETPFSKIRSQASTLARALSLPPVQEDEEEPAREEKPLERPVWVNEYQEEPELRLPPLFEDVPPPQTTQSQPSNRGAAPNSSFTPPVTEQMQIDRLLSDSGSTQSEPLSQYQSVELAYTSLYLACTLVPRLPNHQITGDLVSLLRRWCSDLCTAYGWRLVLISSGEDYLSWVAQMTPAASPEEHLKIFRTHISKKIFEHFPLLGQENPSGDFWAAGYLVSGSSELQDPNAVQAFIRQVRQRQGFSW